MNRTAELTSQGIGQPPVATTDYLEMSHVTRRFGAATAVDRLDLAVRQGEIFALLGPSGCGKTTSLRMIAGLEPVDEGRISLAGRDLVNTHSGAFLRPERRNVGMVFQSYAIWPHMTVSENVAFPLKMRKTSRAERREKVHQALVATGLSAVADRPATALSGGQQQRVALARSLVYQPDLLLLDEPLSNLDAKLRVQMRREIRRLNSEFGLTMVFVTHDQDEALSLADRIAVMNDGRVEQVGRPSDLYERPETAFVRDFLGRMLALRGTLSRIGGSCRVIIQDSDRVITVADAPTALTDGSPVGIYCRPEDVDILPMGSDAGPDGNEIPASILSVAYLGDCLEYVVRVGGEEAVLTAPRSRSYRVGDGVILRVPADRAIVWPL